MLLIKPTKPFSNDMIRPFLNLTFDFIRDYKLNFSI